MLKAEDWLRPDWAGVRACQTGLGFNLGWRQGDVRANQAALAAHLGAPPVFLSQVHGTLVVRLRSSLLSDPRPEADAAVCTDPGLAVAIPAVLAYNLFGKWVAACEAELEGFAHDLRELLTAKD